MRQSSKELIRWLVGLAAALVLMYMSYLSLQEQFTLATSVILGMLALTTLLVYGTERMIEVVEALHDLLRGGN